AAIGFEAFDALTAAENHEDIEISLRARYLVRLMQVAWVVESDPPEVKSLLEDYESKSEPERVALIQRLAGLEDSDGLAVLCRMVRFEKSLILSKQAAAAIIGQRPTDDESAARRREQTIRRIVGRASRPAAVWLQNYLTGLANPAAAIEPWEKLVAREERLALDAPQQTRPELVGALRRELAVLLRRSGRAAEADALLLKIVAREPETAATEDLIELLDWLAAQRAFAAIDQAVARFSERFDDEPLLLYALARIRRAQAKEDLANEAAAKALATNDGRDNGAAAHAEVARQLTQRYWSDFAMAELRRVIELAKPGDRESLLAYYRVGEMLHDQAQDLEAATLLETGAAGADEAAREMGIEPPSQFSKLMRARMHFFYACDLASPNDRPKRVEHLVAALENDPTDADVLIALHREKDLEPALRDSTRDKIAKAADEFRSRIQQEPDNPSPYNQLAWLLANTDGDRNEALRCSQKSLELVRADPDSTGSEASLLDTLGHCYFALGDFENAVKYQSRAVKLDRQSGLMNKALNEFRAALEKSSSKKPQP
ncbi:MAG TPA: tetratricopeptide repeat protein, partial [Pirellulales bacterium]|nr:tetratricopeptide repeat protein [Pirellulales bacterium]